MNIGKQIKHYRLKKGVRQDQMAEFLNISPQAVSKWETENGLPDVTLLPRIAVYLGVTIDELFRLSEEEQLERIENAIWQQLHIEAPVFERYVDFLRRAIAENREPLRSRVALAQLYNRRAAEDHRIADQIAREAVELDPESHGGWSALIEANSAACGDEWWDNSAELIEFCKAFLQNHPDGYWVLYTMIENMLRDKRYDEVEPYIEMLHPRQHNGQCDFYLGDVCLARGQKQQAVDYWNRAVQENADKWQAWCSRADRMKKLGHFDEALADYLHCMEIQTSPRLTDGHYSAAQLLEQLGRFEEAIEQREKIIKVLEEDYGTSESDEIEEQKSKIARLQKQIQH